MLIRLLYHSTPYATAPPHSRAREVRAYHDSLNHLLSDQLPATTSTATLTRYSWVQLQRQYELLHLRALVRVLPPTLRPMSVSRIIARTRHRSLISRMLQTASVNHQQSTTAQHPTASTAAALVSANALSTSFAGSVAPALHQSSNNRLFSTATHSPRRPSHAPPTASSPGKPSATSTAKLIRAHGPTGELTDLLLAHHSSEWTSLRTHALSLPSLVLSRRQQCDIEMLLNGGFSPLTGFMGRADYDSVVEKSRLADGTLWPMPVTLDVDEEKVKMIEASGEKSVALKDEEGNIIAVMEVTDVWQPDKEREAQQVFGGDPEHPAIVYLHRTAGTHYIGGKVTGLQLIPHYDHTDLRLSPQQTREYIAQQGWTEVTAFQTRNPLHRAHFELTLRALQTPNSHLLLHPVVGLTKPGDIAHHTRVKCYRAIMSSYPPGKALLSVLPLAMRMAGPREAIWHAIIRQNYGATSFIIGRDHAGPGSNSKGVDFYSPYAARDEALKHQSELAIRLLPFEQMVYVPARQVYLGKEEVKAGEKTETLSGTEVRRRLQSGADIPEWFSFPSVVAILRQAHPPQLKQGYCLFFTGLSGSGKSTIANALLDCLMAVDSRPTHLLDGDHVRQMLSSELGFSTAHRNLNIQRIAFVADLNVQSGAAVIAAPIAPYQKARQWARDLISQHGGFIEVYVATPISVCEQRDRKGLYEKARKGLLKHFTGIDDPYEPPAHAEVVVTDQDSVQQAVDKIVQHLREKGYLKADEHGTSQSAVGVRS